jgi:hypothetical protein
MNNPQVSLTYTFPTTVVKITGMNQGEAANQVAASASLYYLLTRYKDNFYKGEDAVELLYSLERDFYNELAVLLNDYTAFVDILVTNIHTKDYQEYFMTAKELADSRALFGKK